MLNIRPINHFFKKISYCLNPALNHLASPYQMCNSKPPLYSNQIPSQKKADQQEIKVTKQQISMMYKFMTQAHLSTPEQNEAVSEVEGVDQYFKSSQHKVSLSLLQLNLPQQFLGHFKQFKETPPQMSQKQYIQVKLLILYQYWQVGGKIGGEGKLPELASNFLKDIMLHQNIQCLQQNEMSQLLTLFISLSQNDPSFKQLLPKAPPLLKQLPNKSTTIINKLSFLYQGSATSLLSILRHYIIKTEDVSCWELLSVYLSLFTLYKGENLGEEKQVEVRTHLNNMCQIIGEQFRNWQKNEGIEDGDEESVIRHSPVAFLELLIKNIPLVGNQEQGIQSLNMRIFDNFLNQQNRLQELKINSLIPLLYTGAVTFQEYQNGQTVQYITSILRNLYLSLQKQVKNQLSSNSKVTYTNYGILWKTTMILYKSKGLSSQMYQLLDMILPCFHQPHIIEQMQRTPQYHETFILKQNLIFEMLVTYRIVLPPTNNFPNYQSITQQISGNRPILIRLLTQIRKIYERYYLSGTLDHNLVKNMIIVAMIGKAYSDSSLSEEHVVNTLSPISLYLSPTIKQALLQNCFEFSQYQKFISGCLNTKY